MKTATLNWITEQVNNTKGLVRAKKTKEKVIGYLNLINDFSEENQCITKKELTKIKNMLDNMCSTYYGLLKGGEFVGDDKYSVLDKLAQSRGFDSYISAYGEKGQPFNILSGFSTYGLSSIKFNIKNIDGVELNSTEKKFYNKFYPNMVKWYELHLAIVEITAILNPTKEQKELKKLNEIKGNVNPNLKNAIDDIAETFRKVIEKNQISYYNRNIETFKADCPDGYKTNMRDDDGIVVDYPNVLRYMLDYDKTTYVYTLKSNYADIVKKVSYEYSVEVIVSWQLKMYDKLGGDFLGSIEQSFTTEVIGSKYLYNDIIFNFDDGSCFTLRNQLVSKVSHLGTFFYTYPTTFHDAYLPDGSKVDSPDEYNVKKAFQKVNI